METIDWRCSTLPAASLKAHLDVPPPSRKRTAPEGWAKATRMLRSFHLNPPDPRENFDLERAVLRRAAMAADLRQPLPSSGLTLVRMMASRQIPQLHQRSIAKVCPSGVSGFDVVHGLAFRHEAETRPPRPTALSAEPIADDFRETVATAALRCRPFSQCGVVSLAPLRSLELCAPPQQDKAPGDDPFELTACSFYHATPRNDPPTRGRTSGGQGECSQFGDTLSWKNASMHREQLLQKINEVQCESHPLPPVELSETTRKALRGVRQGEPAIGRGGELVLARSPSPPTGRDDQVVPFFISQRDAHVATAEQAKPSGGGGVDGKPPRSMSMQQARRKIRIWKRTSYDPVEEGRRQRRMMAMERKVSPRLVALHNAVPKRIPPPLKHLSSYEQYLVETHREAAERAGIRDASRQVHLPVYRHSKGFV